MSARRRTVGVPMLARARRPVVELHVRRERALGNAVLWIASVGMAAVVGGMLGQALVMWWGGR
jgi:hypothetical protein